MQTITRRHTLRAGAGLLALAARPARAAAWPDRPVRVIAPFAPGGPSDLMARLLSAKLADALGQPFYVENRAGAGSNIGTAVAARSTPDGYTLLLTSSAFVVNPGLYKKIPYDAVADFAPVAELVTSPNVFIATPASGITSIEGLVAAAKARPEFYNYASAGIGTTPHLATEMLKTAAGIKLQHVPFAGAGPAMQAILSGTVPLGCAALPGAHPSILNHDIKALAVTGTERWYDLPDVPTMLELGYKGFVSDTFHALLAPAGTPTDIVAALAKASNDAIKQPAFHEQLRTLGFEIIANGPEGLKRRIETELPMYRDVISRASIEPV
jgi:tripartite-type tricarboxylate transporter receptor subunit TctC